MTRRTLLRRRFFGRVPSGIVGVAVQGPRNPLSEPRQAPRTKDDKQNSEKEAELDESWHDRSLPRVKDHHKIAVFTQARRCWPETRAVRRQFL